MASCDLCGNTSDYPIEVNRLGKSGTFDSFECAIHVIAPECGHCGCKIIGHPTYAQGKVFCCENCVPETSDGQVSTATEYEDVTPLP